nr:hypothetical protein [Tanacetum cinerariifolium]
MERCYVPSQYTPPLQHPQSKLSRTELITHMIKTQEHFNITQEQFNMNQEQFNINFQVKIENLQAEMSYFQEMLSLRDSNQDPFVDLYYPIRSDEEDMEIDLLTDEPLDTFLMGNMEIEFNLLEDIDDLVPIPMVSEEPFFTSIDNPLFIFNSDYALNFENLIFECECKEMCDDEHFTFDTFDHVTINALFEIDFKHDANFVNPLFQNQLSNQKFTPLPISKPIDISLWEVERFNHFFSLTRSSEMTWVMVKLSRQYTKIPSPCLVAYILLVRFYRYYHPHLTLSVGYDLMNEPK